MIHNGDILKFETPLCIEHKKDKNARYIAWQSDSGMRIFFEGENFCEDCGAAENFKNYTIIGNVYGDW